MKLVSFLDDGRARFGALTPDGIADLATAGCPDLRTALARAVLPELATAATRFLPLDAVTLLPPIPVSDKVLCVGLNYRTHVAETGAAMPANPSLFVRFPGSQVGHLQPILRPFLSDAFDYEGELAVVIGTGGRHIAAGEALRHVAGYTCFADNSLRDYQRHTAQATAGKNFEHSGACGPWMVTADEIPDPSVLTLVTRLNGREVQRSGLDDLIFSVPELIAYASAFARLEPGDVIATGTPAGVGMARDPQLFMRAGDELEIEIDRIGILRNQVADEVRP